LGAPLGVGPGSFLTHPGEPLPEQAAVCTIARRAAPDVLANGFVCVGRVIRVAFERFQGRTSDSFGVGKIVPEAPLQIPE